MYKQSRFVSVALLVAVTLPLLTGCHSTMPTQSDSATNPSVAPNQFPLKCVDHGFGSYCYNTLACTVVYNNYDFNHLDAHTPSGPPPSSSYRAAWWPASHGGIRNFPSPAEVRWTSLDGVKHAAKVDMAAIFRNERVLYRVADAEIPDGMFAQGLVAGPSIFLEVNDRTINVYMAAMIPTKTEQIPGNKYSKARTDLMLAWTQTY